MKVKIASLQNAIRVIQQEPNVEDCLSLAGLPSYYTVS